MTDSARVLLEQMQGLIEKWRKWKTYEPCADDLAALLRALPQTPANWEYAHEAERRLLEADGWMCEQHPGKEWPHDDCSGPGRTWKIEGKAAILAVLPTDTRTDRAERGTAVSAQSPVPADHPLMIAWEAYKRTDEFANTKSWLKRGSPTNGDGELWAAFEAGFRAASPVLSSPSAATQEEK